jgi:hypothetical protein
LVVPFLLILRARDGRIVHTRDYSARDPLIQKAPTALSLELVTVPVADDDRAKSFYVDQVGFRPDQDHQVDQLVVEDVSTVQASLRDHGVAVSEVQPG